ncbi:MAG: hypothetical protein CMJ89_14890 [Planctomycetes bacterium]|jgi:hypothetical protein|nr:hypothetical protein [Planctomycetota bacterium]
MNSKTEEPGAACREVRERIPLFIGGDLDLEVLATVREHLQRCPSCAEAVRTAERGREALVATLRQREADYRCPALWEGVRSALQEEGLLGDRSVSPAIPSRWPTLANPADSSRPGKSGMDPVHLPSPGPQPRGRLLRRVAAWGPVVAAACVLFLLWKGDGSGPSPDLETSAGPLADRSGSAGLLDRGSGPEDVAPRAIPVANVQLKKVLPNEENFTEDAEEMRFPLRRGLRKRPQRTPASLTGYE